MFKKVLIANRGEIAVRIIRALKELGITSVAIFSQPDHLSRHVSLADESYMLEGQPAKVYLDGAQIIDIAKRAGAEAVHPGYGFLSENAEFARECIKAGLVFIGPSPEVITRMGSKVESRKTMEAAGVPVVPGTTEPVSDIETVKKLGAKYGFPLAIKASAGGGGRGLRVVRSEAEIEAALSGAQREGATYFSDSMVYVEKYLDKPRHIEVQVLGDSHGNVVHLGERECSLQRRHQKLLEESPAANLNPALRERLLKACVAGAKALNYTSAGTFECLVHGDEFYFLEVNTRVQVEHPVTEFVTGIDIVKEQIRIAAGYKLSFTQEDVTFRGCAIECRINAEDPGKVFMPSPGTLAKYEEPRAAWVRVDSACYPGYQILPFYDSLLAKLIVWGRTRDEAIARVKIALNEFDIKGVATTIPFHQAVLEAPEYVDGHIHTGFVEGEFKTRLSQFMTQWKAAQTAGQPGAGTAASAGQSQGQSQDSGQAATLVRTEPRSFEVCVDKRYFKVQVNELVDASQASSHAAKVASAVSQSSKPVQGVPSKQQGPASSSQPVASKNGKELNGAIYAEMHGLVKQVLVTEGQQVSMGDRLIIFEAMKMESEILAHKAGKIKSLPVKNGDTVEAQKVLIVLGD